MKRKRIIRHKIYGDEEVEPCPRCKWLYPDWWFNPVFIGNKGYTEPICGQCAFETINEHLGIKRERFDGSQAEYNRQQVLEWRKDHPECAPK